MKGFVTKKGKSWYVVLDLDRDETGKRCRKWLSVRKELNLPKPATKRQAEELLVMKLGELQQGIYIDPSKITLAEYLYQWLTDYCQPNLRQSTYDSYKTFIDNHIIPAIGKVTLANLKPTHLQSLYSEKLSSGRLDGKPGGLSPRSVHLIHTILFESLKQAVKWELIVRNVAEAVAPPKHKSTKKDCWTTDQVKAFLNAASEHRHYPLYLLALTTGMRRGELLGLRWRDIDLDQGKLNIQNSRVRSLRTGAHTNQQPKTENSLRSVSISPLVCETLRKHRQRQLEELLALGLRNESGLVFLSEVGTPISADNLRRNFKLLSKKAELPEITIHALRHTHATMLLQQGVHPKIVSERLGHSRVGITLDIYSHVIPGMQDQAADDLEKRLFR